MDLDGDPRHVRTQRLHLDAVTSADVPDIFAIGRSLEDVWWTFPPTGVTEPDQVAELVETAVTAWERDRLGYWVVRDSGARIVLGVGGCSQIRARAWSLYYRMRMSAQGQGLAGELVAEARDWASRTDPALPVTAVLEERNVRAAGVVERAGLTVVYREPDPSPMGGRLVYADRDLPDGTAQALLGPIPHGRVRAP